MESGVKIINCKYCQKIFRYYGEGPKVCSECKKEDNEMFDKVKNYLRENPQQGLAVVAEECEVPVKRIQQWIREERLEFTSAEGSGLTCERCGESITTGRFCKKCKSDLVKSFGSMQRAEEAPVKQKTSSGSGARMRFMQNRDH